MSEFDLERFKILYAEFYKQSYRYVKSYVRDDLAAEDIVSESLVKLWQLSLSEDILNPKAILLTILRNKSLDYLKHQKVKLAALDNISEIAQRDLDIRIYTNEATDPNFIFEKDIKRIVFKTLSALPEQTRKIFEESRFENMSKTEIAQKYNISVKGVDYHLYKALSSLKNRLKSYLYN